MCLCAPICCLLPNFSRIIFISLNMLHENVFYLPLFSHFQSYSCVLLLFCTILIYVEMYILNISQLQLKLKLKTLANSFGTGVTDSVHLKQTAESYDYMVK